MSADRSNFFDNPIFRGRRGECMVFFANMKQSEIHIGRRPARIRAIPFNDLAPVTSRRGASVAVACEKFLIGRGMKP
jgi:hypothetical protein